MEYNVKELLAETEKLNKDKAALKQQLREAKISIDGIKTGNIDALVIAQEKALKVYTESTADKPYRILIEKMHEGAVTLHADRTILYCNSYFANMVNLPLQKVIGTIFDKFIDNTAKGFIETLFKQGSADTLKKEVYIHSGSGKKIPVLMTADAMSLDNVFVLGIILTDLTEQNENQEILKQRTKELEEKNKELEIANRQLGFQIEEKGKRAAELVIADKEVVIQHEEKEKRAAELIIADKEIVIQHEEKEKQVAANEELESFSYSVSHDLRTPLRHINGFIDLLVKNNSPQLDEAGIRYLNTISESSHEMESLIDALLTFSRFSRAELVQTKINSKNLVTQVINTFNEDIASRNIEINISELPDTMGDETLINQVWVNLISNAIKYSRKKEKAVIDIGSKIENDKTIFFIKDNGAGFDMKYADKLFGVFQRLHRAKDFEGIGIGLANVNRIITRHGGKCWAEGEVNKGATFFFSLPNNQ